jgi:hypothetical protein
MASRSSSPRDRFAARRVLRGSRWVHYDNERVIPRTMLITKIYSAAGGEKGAPHGLIVVGLRGSNGDGSPMRAVSCHENPSPDLLRQPPRGREREIHRQDAHRLCWVGAPHWGLKIPTPGLNHDAGEKYRSGSCSDGCHLFVFAKRNPTIEHLPFNVARARSHKALYCRALDAWKIG